MNTEELRILLRTVADTSGARSTQQALNGVQRQATETGRAAAAAGAQTSNAFATSGRSILAFAGALGLATTGSQMLAQAVQTTLNVFTSSLQTLRENERLVRATGAAYGAQAQNFEKFAAALSTQTGFTSQAILQAALSARTLSANYGLTIQQTQRLIQVSADLARIRGIGIAESFERIQSAIRGEAEASEYLGLTLNDTFIKNNAMNGSLRNTFETMSDAQKAQVRFNEVLRQTAPFAGLATSAANSLDGAFGKLEVSADNAQKALGKTVAPETVFGLRAMAYAMDLFANNSDRALASLLGLSPILSGLGKLREDFQNFPLVRRETEGRAQAAALNEELELQRRILLAHNEAALAAVRAQAATQAAMQAAAQRVVPAAALNQSDEIIRRLSADIELFGQRAQQLGSILSALPVGDIMLRAGLQAEQGMQRIDAAVTARLAAAEKLRRARELEQGATRVFDPRDAAGVAPAHARIALTDQLEAAHRDLIAVQEQERDIGRERVRLVAIEAQMVQDILPARQELARLEREITAAGNERLRIQREMRVNAAQLAAAPSQFALEDTQRQLERSRLVLADRSQSTEERAQARRDIRDINRRVLPSQALGAFDAQAAVLQAEREQRITGLEARQRQLPLEDRRVVLGQALQPREDAIVAFRQSIERQESLVTTAAAAVANQQQVIEQIVASAIEQGIAAGQTKPTTPIQVTVNVTHADGRTDTYNELIEANGQALIPPAIPMSGVRRGPF